ncbi:MAG: hypothetical protein WKF79_06725 [Nocardioides sp.]
MVKRWAGALVKVLAVGALAVSAVGFTTVSSGELPGTNIRTSLDGESVRLSMPSGDGTPKGVALWFHGQGGNANNRVESPFLEALRRDGWVIASSDFHSTSWGNPESTEDTRRLINWAQAQTGLEVKLWVSGSMGGAVTLNALNFGIEAPPCWYGVKPAISLTQMDRVPGGPRFIESAYAGPVPPDRDPVRNLGTLPISTRYRVVASEADHWVIYDENTAPLILALSLIGADVSLLEATGLHEDPSHWNADDLKKFANSCVDGGEGSFAEASN